MSAIRLRPDTWIEPPPPPPKQPSKKSARKARIRALQTEGADPDGDVIRMELLGPAYGAYRNRLWNRNPHCCYCGQVIKKEGEASLDHIVARVRGGLNSPSNLVLACGRCNNLKGDRDLLDWFHTIKAVCISVGLVEDPDEPEDDEERDPADWWKDAASSG